MTGTKRLFLYRLPLVSIMLQYGFQSGTFFFSPSYVMAQKGEPCRSSPFPAAQLSWKLSSKQRRTRCNKAAFHHEKNAPAFRSAHPTGSPQHHMAPGYISLPGNVSYRGDTPRRCSSDIPAHACSWFDLALTARKVFHAA